MQTVKTDRTSRKEAFSLFELMVTMTLLVVLVSLLVPAVRSVKQSAETVKCANQLRSWGVSFQLYAADNNGFYPISWINNSDQWSSFIAPYVESSWLSYDPVTFAKRLDNRKCGCPGYVKFNHPADPNFRAMPYAYNAGRFDYPFANPGSSMKGTVEHPDAWVPGPAPAGWVSEDLAVRYNGTDAIGPLATVSPTHLYTRPAECVTMFCGVASTWKYMSAPYHFWFSGGGGSDWDARTGDGLVTDENGISAYDLNAAPAGVHSHRGMTPYFHTGIGAWIQIPAGKDNYLFMDGHVETLDVTDPKIDRYVYNQIPNNNNPYR